MLGMTGKNGAKTRKNTVKTKKVQIELSAYCFLFVPSRRCLAQSGFTVAPTLDLE